MTNGLGKELLRLRTKFGLPRRALSVILDCSEMALFRLESGRVKKPHPHYERRLTYLVEALQKKEKKEARDGR